MRGILIGFVLAAALVGMFFLGFRARDNERLTRASATYLFADTEILGADGKPLSRSDLLDALLRDAVKRAQ